MISRLKNVITGRTGRNWDLNAVFRSPESIIFPLYHDFSEYVFSNYDSENASYSVVSDSLRPHTLYSPWNSPGQNTGVSSLSLLQGIYPTQRSSSGLLHCRWILYQLSYEESPNNPFFKFFTIYSKTVGLEVRLPIMWKFPPWGSVGQQNKGRHSLSPTWLLPLRRFRHLLALASRYKHQTGTSLTGRD